MLIAAIVFFVFFYKPTLTIRTTPSDAQVLLNNQVIATGTPIKLDPGTYSLVVKRTGYLSTTQDISLGISQVVDLPIELRQIPSVQQLTGGVQYPVLSTDTKSILYLGKDGKQFFRVDTELSSDGKPRVQAISSERFQNIANIYWSPERNLVIYQTTQGQTKLFDFERYDLLNQTELELGANLRGLSWHPTQQVVAAFRQTPEGERSLVRINVNTNATERLADLRDLPLSNPKVYWSPDGRTIALVENAVYLIDVNTRALTTLAGSTGATDLSWHPVRPEILVASDNALKVLPISGTSALPTIRTSLAKAAWTNDGGALITAIDTDTNQDQLRAFLVADGTTVTYRYQSSYPVNATNLLPIDSGEKLYFTTDNTLYSLVLEPESDTTR